MVIGEPDDSFTVKLQFLKVLILCASRMHCFQICNTKSYTVAQKSVVGTVHNQGGYTEWRILLAVVRTLEMSSPRDRGKRVLNSDAVDAFRR